MSPRVKAALSANWPTRRRKRLLSSPSSQSIVFPLPYLHLTQCNKTLTGRAFEPFVHSLSLPGASFLFIFSKTLEVFLVC